MTQAVNLANFANNLDSSGGVSPSALNGAVTIAKGGTGATTASAARTALGLAIGTDIPSLTGTGASGTWGINISGTAAAATNPASGGSFITSSNIGSQSVSFATNSTNATNATNATSATSATNATNAANLVATNWTVLQSGTSLLFRYNGANRMQLDSSGNLTVIGNVTAYGAL
jgi:hypothetical protein